LLILAIMEKRSRHCRSFCFTLYLAVFFILSCVPGDALSKANNPVIPQGSRLSLNQAVKIALLNNRTLQRSRLSLSSNNLNVKMQEDKFNIKIIPASFVNYSAAGDEYWSASVKFSKKTKVGISGSVTPQVENNYGTKRMSIGVMLNVPLLRGLGVESNLDGLHGSWYALETAKQAHYKQQDSLVINTVSTVYDIINHQKHMELLGNQIEGLKRHISLTAVKERTGLATAMDMYRAEIRLKEVQNQLTIIEKKFDSQTDRLKKLLGSSIQGDLTVTASIEYEPISIFLDEAVSIALNNRVEIEQALRKSTEAQRKVAIARHNILPIVNLKLGYKRYEETESLFLDEEDWIVSLNGSAELFRSEERTAYELANINFQQSKIDIESSREDIIREVRAQVNQMKKRERLIADRGEQLRQAQGKLELARSKFNHQLANNFDLLEAQTQRQQVKADLLIDTIGYIVDTYRLRSVLGTLIER